MCREIVVYPEYMIVCIKDASIVVPIPYAKSDNLLLHLFQCDFMVIPHSKELLDLLILLCGDVN